MTEQRKATDVLLDLEGKINALLDMVRGLDLNLKILSNKQSDIISKMDKQPSRITVETVQSPHPQVANIPAGFTQLPGGDPARNIPILANSSLPQENSPQGFRRTSRPETYASVKAEPDATIQMPVQLPPGSQRQAVPDKSEVIIPPAVVSTGKKKAAKQAAIQAEQDVSFPEADLSVSPPAGQGQIPVSQRCVDRNGKSIFLASVEVMDIESGQEVFKTRTSATGKWAAPLAVGNYRVYVRKAGSSIKDKLESVQDVRVDGSRTPMELPMVIIK